jgi:hypothetical protein
MNAINSQELMTKRKEILMTEQSSQSKKELRRAGYLKQAIYREWKRANRKAVGAQKRADSSAEAIEKWRSREPEAIFVWESERDAYLAVAATYTKQAATLRASLTDADFDRISNSPSEKLAAAAKVAFKLMLVFVVIKLLVSCTVAFFMGFGAGVSGEPLVLPAGEDPAYVRTLSFGIYLLVLGVYFALKKKPTPKSL